MNLFKIIELNAMAISWQRALYLQDWMNSSDTMEDDEYILSTQHIVQANRTAQISLVEDWNELWSIEKDYINKQI